MKITKTQLKKIIKEELGKITEMYRDEAMPFLPRVDDPVDGGAGGDDQSRKEEILLAMHDLVVEAGLEGYADTRPVPGSPEMAEVLRQMEGQSVEELEQGLQMYKELAAMGQLRTFLTMMSASMK